ncbi:MAG: tyrosine-type recombinase/integrase [Bryobacteraceae bacterium]
MSNLPDSQRQIVTLPTPILLPTSDQNPALVYLTTRLKSPGSRRTMRQALNTIATLLGSSELVDPALRVTWSSLRYRHTAALAARLAETYAPATANKMMSALRGVLKEAWRLGQMSAEDYQRAVDLPQEKLKGQEAAAGRALTGGEILALVEVCKADTTAAGARDAALIGVLYFGLRRAEVVALNLADYRDETGALFVKGSKGKDRTIYLTGGAKKALAAWLQWRGGDAGALFVRIRRWDTLTASRMTTQAVYTILKDRAAQAGVADFSPHDFRRTFVGELLERGADIATVAKLAGHANVKTTAGYDRRGEQSKQKAAELLHYPF